jgi:hypothetical protein
MQANILSSKSDHRYSLIFALLKAVTQFDKLCQHNTWASLARLYWTSVEVAHIDKTHYLS